MEVYQEKFLQKNLSDLKETDETSERLTIKNSGALVAASKLDRSNRSFLCVIDTHLRSLEKNQRESSRHNSKKSISLSKDKDRVGREQLVAFIPPNQLLKQRPTSRRGTKPEVQALNHNTSSSSSIDDVPSAQPVPQNSSLVNTIEYQAKEILRLNDELNRYKSKYLTAKKTVKELQQTLSQVDSVLKDAGEQASAQEDHCCQCRLSNKNSLELLKENNRKGESLGFLGSSLAVKKLIGASQPIERRKSALLNLCKKSTDLKPDLNRRSSATNSYFKGMMTTANSKHPADPFVNITKRRLAISSLLINAPLMNTTQASNVDCNNAASLTSRLQTSLQQSAINHVRNIRKKSRNELISKLCAKDKLFH
jgi:hypothetical protein